MIARSGMGTCSACGSWASLKDGLCFACRALADYPRDRVAMVPIRLLGSGLRLHAQALASAGFTTARIAELLGAGEADVRRVVGER